MRLSFVETRFFTDRVQELGLEDALRQLQLTLVSAPDAGRLDPGTGGLRKIRMSDPGRARGKRGGARVHYLWLPRARRIYLLYVYRKDERTTLDAAQKRALQHLVRSIKTAVGEESP
jgi:hypothetical protein